MLEKSFKICSKLPSQSAIKALNLYCLLNVLNKYVSTFLSLFWN